VADPEGGKLGPEERTQVESWAFCSGMSSGAFWLRCCEEGGTTGD
jgi:hypothetical protein